MGEAGGPAGPGWVEPLRGRCEPEHHWKYRREFLLRNGEALPSRPGGNVGEDSAELRRLVSFSMVWANHVFLGCRYPPQVMEKVMDMAAGITVTNAPTHTLRDELVAKVKRGISSSNEGSEEPCKKRAMGTDKAGGSEIETSKAEVPMEEDAKPMKNSEKEATENPEKKLPLNVAQKITPTTSTAAAQKIATITSTAASQKAAPATSTAVAQKTASTTSTTEAQKAAPAASTAAAQKAAPAASATEAQKVAPTTSTAASQKAAPATSTPAAQKAAPATSTPAAQRAAPATSTAATQKGAPTTSAAVTQKAAPTTSTAGVRMDAKVSNFESLASTKNKSVLAASLPGSEPKMNYCLTKPSESKSENVLLSEKKVNSEGTAVLKGSSHASAVPVKVPCKLLTSEDAKERQPFFNRLYKAVAWKLVSVGGFSPNVNHAELLNSSIQSVKETLDVEFVPLKELADLPQNKSSQENMVCELRCKSVYLGTGCGKSKENAKAVASREALKLFLKKKVIVKLCKRKYKGREIEDLVLLDEESKPLNLPPALRNPQEILQNSEVVTAYASK